MSESSEVRADYHGRVRSEVLDLVPDGMSSVLDIGGGVGASAAHLKQIGKAEKCVVVDLVADSVVDGIDAAYGGDLEDAELLRRIGREQGPFDVILCLDILEHLTDPWSVVRTAHQILRPGGVIVASIPNARHHSLVIPLVLRGEFELMDEGIRDRTHLRWFVKDTAIRLMTCSGLVLEHVEGKYYGGLSRRYDRLTFGLLADFLYLQYFIRVRRPD